MTSTTSGGGTSPGNYTVPSSGIPGRTTYNISLTETDASLDARFELLNQRISLLEEKLERLEKILHSILPEIKSGIGGVANLE